MKKTISLLIALSLVAGCSSQKLPPLENNDKIMAFGDSLTFGMGAPTPQSWPAQLAQLIGHEVVNEGVNGNTTEDGMQRLEQAIEEHQPQVLILSLGGNDMLRQVNTSTTVQNLNSMIATAKKHRLRVILLAQPQPQALAMVTGLKDAQFYEQVAKSNDIPVIPVTYAKWLSKEQYKSDLIHLNAAGYAKVAQDIHEFMKDTGLVNK